MDIERDYAYGIIPFFRESLGEYIFFLGRTQDTDGRQSFWKFPKGHKDFPEEEGIEAARRELFEEIGIQLPKNAVIESTSFLEEYFYERGEVVVRKINRYWLGQVDKDSREITLDEKEFAEFSWLDYEKAYKLLPENSQKMLTAANDFLVRHRV